jgi:hypothetical protein
VRQNLTAECDHTNKSEVGNNNNNYHKNIIIFMFLFLIIGITLISSSITIKINAQAYSSTAAGSINNISNNNTIGTTGAKQMGICVVGAGGPCNADSNWDGTHDVTGKCVLINGCGNDNAINKNMNNAVSGK